MTLHMLLVMLAWHIQIDVATPAALSLRWGGCLARIGETKRYNKCGRWSESLEDRFPLFGLYGLMLFFVSVRGKCGKKIAIIEIGS